jgi:hypothetical protein
MVVIWRSHRWTPKCEGLGVGCRLVDMYSSREEPEENQEKVQIIAMVNSPASCNGMGASTLTMSSGSMSEGC